MEYENMSFKLLDIKLLSQYMRDINTAVDVLVDLLVITLGDNSSSSDEYDSSSGESDSDQ